MLRIGLFATCIATASVVPAIAAADDPCAIRAGGAAGHGEIVVGGHRSCGGQHGSGGATAPTKTVDCGSREDLHPAPQEASGCEAIVAICLATPPVVNVGPTTITVLLAQRPNGSWQVSGFNCDTPIARQVAPSDAYEELRRLVPHPSIGIAPPGGATLVNIETLFWVNTTATRSLGRVTLLGHRVELEATVDHVAWDFGDGSATTLTGPGRPYDPNDPCTTPICDEYWGHIYRRSGTTIVTATTTWIGRYRIDGGDWTRIRTPVAGPPSVLDITVREARAVIVRGP